MKFLGRMTNTEYQKEFAPEFPSSNNLLRYAKLCYSVTPCSKAQRDNQHKNSFACIDAASADGEELFELFNGFQKNGALEKDPLISDLATPNFATYVEKMTEKETETTEDKMKLVKEKLEKMLLTCARNFRHASATTNGGKILEEATKNGKEEIVDPLQHDVFGSEVGGPYATIVKEHRDSLRELFQMTNMTAENDESISSIRIEKRTDKPSVPLLKKIPNERTIHHSSKRSTSASVGTIDSAASADEKLHKILRMLHRVYPEASAISQKTQNLWKYVTNSSFTDGEEYRNRNHMLSEDVVIFPYTTITKMSADHTKSKVSDPKYGGGDTNWKRECWIKSDAECKPDIGAVEAGKQCGRTCDY
ncbi:LAZY 1-like protein [Tanacetum coccineum]